MKIKTPFDCHLWNNDKLTKDDLYNSLNVIEEYDDDSHQMRSVKKCKKCGQLYFYEFKEFIDWKEGNDAQYRTWIPVENKEQAEKMSNENALSLLTYPSIRIDFPSDANKPTKPYYSNVKDKKTSNMDKKETKGHDKTDQDD